MSGHGMSGTAYNIDYGRLYDVRTGFEIGRAFNSYSVLTDMVQANGGRMSKSTLSEIAAKFGGRVLPARLNSKPLAQIDEAITNELHWTVDGIAAAMAKVERRLREVSQPTRPATGQELASAIIEARSASTALLGSLEPHALDFSTHLIVRAHVQLHKARTHQSHYRAGIDPDIHRASALRHFQIAQHLLDQSCSRLDLVAALDVVSIGLLKNEQNDARFKVADETDPVDLFWAMATVLQSVRVRLNQYYSAFEQDELERNLDLLPRARRAARQMVGDEAFLRAVALAADWSRDPRLVAHAADAVGLDADTAGNAQDLIDVGAELLIQAIDIDGDHIPEGFDIFSWSPAWMQYPISDSDYMRGVCNKVNEKRKEMTMVRPGHVTL